MRWGHESTESSPRQYFAAWSDKRGHNAEGRIDSPRSREEDRGREEDRAEVTLHERRRGERATLLPKRCSPSGLGKQRATGLPRGVINHFLLRKAVEREREKGDSRAGSSRESGSRVDGLARDSRIEPIDLISLAD